MAENETRALTAALSGPAFVSKGGGAALHTANRHVERWAPEAGAHRVRSLRNLGFVDRLVSPWIETAQRSASLRMFSQYRSSVPERQNVGQPSWVFPRPWYQDELDWMAASRESAAQQAAAAAYSSGGMPPAMLTTRGTYVTPEQRQSVALPTALYEFVAPSLSIAPPVRGDLQADAYSPLVPFAAVQAAQVMANAVAPIAQRMLTPNLRAVLQGMLERSGQPATPIASTPEATRVAQRAPELVTPPAPRPEPEPVAIAPVGDVSALRAADDVGTQRTQIAELQRQANLLVAQRGDAARAASVAREAAADEARRAEARQGEQRREAARAAEAARSSETVERGRVDERIAQRMAERVREQDAQRREAQAQVERAARQQHEATVLHHHAREAAARDARNLTTHEAAPTTAPSVETASARVPEQLATVIANMSPQLASTLASGLAQHPERAAQTIAQLDEALRNVELMARNAAIGGTIESSRGPRLVMPAGLGGLVATVDRNVAATRSAQMLPFAQGSAQGSAPSAVAQQMAVQQMAAQQLAAQQLAAQHMTAQQRAAHQVAAQQTQAQQQHAMVAARTRLPAMTFLAEATPTAPQTAFAAAESVAPSAIHHVAWADRWLARFAGARTPSLDLLTASSAVGREQRFAALAAAAPESIFVAPQFDGATAQLVTERATPITPEAAPLRRYGDDEVTPDDELVAISQAATRTRLPQQVTAPELQFRAEQRLSIADAVAHGLPAAPNAGLAAQLASSPFAPALRHIFPLASAPAFDVRALFGEQLSAAYLAGILAPATREVATGAALGAGMTSQDNPLTLSFEAPITRAGLDWSPTYVSPQPDVDAVDAAVPTAAEYTAAPSAVTTMRSALLSWEAEATRTPSGTDMRVSAPSVSFVAPDTSVARSMVEAMALPMLGDRASHVEPGRLDTGDHYTAAHVPAFAAPGMIADRAHAWSVAQERSASDLAFDFVTPELVLAARVYGLGPIEAAQAMRLAIAGPGQLTTMASTVDRTFVQALSIEAERRERAQHAAQPTVTAYPRVDQAPAAAIADGTAPSPTALPSVATRSADATTSAFGVDRRMPRGVYMWPPATIAALGLTAAAPDGEQAMSVAALELLAAQSVAALGTFAALGPAVMPDDAEVATTATAAGGTLAQHASMFTPTLAAAAMATASSAPVLEASESDVIATATAMVPAARRAKFEAMYVALGQSGTSRSWTPAARAARALALAGRGDDAITSHERAQAAWDVLPVVAPMDAAGALVGDDLQPGASMSTGVAAQRQAQVFALAARRAAVQLPEYVESRPGLAGLSARAGEALTAFVAPVGSPIKSASATESESRGSREHGAALRAPTAAQEMVRTGRPTGRFGGGEAEIPVWFEQAARRMFDSQHGSMSDGISLAELTLVNAAPSTAIAASTRGVPSAAPTVPNPSAQGTQTNAAQQIDVEKVANEVYKQILVLMDSARFRNGEPYL